MLKSRKREGEARIKRGPQPQKCIEGLKRLLTGRRGDKPKWQNGSRKKNTTLSVLTRDYVYLDLQRDGGIGCPTVKELHHSVSVQTVNCSVWLPQLLLTKHRAHLPQILLLR